MTKQFLQDAVNRFLGWKLPKDFMPDNYISFDRSKISSELHYPTGTNLLTAKQAEQMLSYVCAAMLSEIEYQHTDNSEWRDATIWANENARREEERRRLMQEERDLLKQELDAQKREIEMLKRINDRLFNQMVTLGLKASSK